MIISGLNIYYNETYETIQALFNVLVLLDLSKKTVLRIQLLFIIFALLSGLIQSLFV